MPSARAATRIATVYRPEHLDALRKRMNDESTRLPAGCFFERGAADPELAKRLWAVSEELVGQSLPL